MAGCSASRSTARFAATAQRRRAGQADHVARQRPPAGRVHAITDGKVTTPLVLFDADGRKRAVFEPAAGGQLPLAHVYDATGREAPAPRSLKETSPVEHVFLGWVMRHTGTGRAE